MNTNDVLYGLPVVQQRLQRVVDEGKVRWGRGRQVDAEARHPLGRVQYSPDALSTLRLFGLACFFFGCQLDGIDQIRRVQVADEGGMPVRRRH